MSRYLIAHIGHTTKWVEHVTWWAPDSKGYRVCIDKAGLYSEEEAMSICRYGGCLAVTKDLAQSIARSTPYYRRVDGTLNKLYDGDSHTVVPNSRETWQTLIKSCLPCSKRTEKPTPISAAKVRSIYLDESIAKVKVVDHG